MYTYSSGKRKKKIEKEIRGGERGGKEESLRAYNACLHGHLWAESRLPVVAVVQI